MKDYVANRSREVGAYLLKTKATIRKAAKVFGVSQSTIHKDATKRLELVNPKLAKEVRKVLDYNLKVRHIRGGESTRRRYYC
ncbi:sporulation transcriptional regulator SpoIIID [Clostridium haemolyticum]|uniref:Stage III sporulation protein D n=1 Tax=Clostridium haemolyticum NCTC 9693 TaxID=1443114 RepID=A0ABR4THE6_CLOHA|nr:sporulation transcriptional regulator SpoIIID [Clostridium haemolyticum]KEI18280.1 stage III sporulation protein D [Clostridium haemolyticum NCTC 9693]KGN04204.1 stage III sporulation protein D [Clostridium haemolyticum NCTC 8350]